MRHYLGVRWLNPIYPYSMASLRLAFVAILTALLSTGCATYNRIADHPDPDSNQAVQIVKTPLSRMNDLPIGSVYDKDNQIVVVGHQKGIMPAVLLGGVVGVLAVDQLNRSVGNDAYGDATKSENLNVSTLAEEVLSDLLAAHPEGRWDLRSESSPQSKTLQLNTHAVFVVRKDGQARLFAMLRAQLIGPDGKPSWDTQYFARGAEDYPIGVEDGWRKGTRFADNMTGALTKCFRACYLDSQGKLTGTRTVTLKGPFPYLPKDNFTWPVMVVHEDDDEWIVKLLAGDVAVLAGTHVINPNDFEIEEKELKDPRR